MAIKTPKPDPNFEHIALGPSNEELARQDAEAKIEREQSGYPKVEFGRDAADKHMFDERMDAVDPWSAPNPMEETVAPHKEAGMAYKFLSPRVCEVLGMRGYQVVHDANGDPVKMGNMLLGKIPERIAEARRRKFEQESNERVGEMQNEYADNVNRMKRDAKDMGLRVLEPGEMSGEFTDPHTGRRINIG